MAVQKTSCDLCGSANNRVIFENGSEKCMTPGCTYYKSNSSNNIIMSQYLLTTGSFQPLGERRLSQKTCEFFNYQTGIDEFNKPCQIANYTDSTGKVIAQKLRYEDKTFRWKGEPSKSSLFGKSLWSNKSNAIIITEGEIDALSVAESQDCKWPVVSVPNGAQAACKALKTELDWLSGFKQIILCFDMDDAGRIATEQCAGLFPPGKVRVANLSKKDANEVLVSGKTIELTKLIWNAAEWRPDNAVSGSDIKVSELFEPEPKGITLPYPLLNEMIRGLKSHRIYTIYAGTGAGKTSILKEMVYFIRNNNPETGIAGIFLEESLKYTVKSLIALDNNIPTYILEENPDVVSDDNKEKSYSQIIFNGKEDKMFFYKHFGSLDSTRLFNMLEYFVVGKGVKIIALDHLSILISGLDSSSEGERVVIDRTMTALRSFSERTGCIILLATQLRRTEGSYNTGAEINEASARGSAAIEHLSDVIFSLNRNTESDSPNDAQIKVIKNRVSGIIGSADLIYYDPKTGRYLPKKNTMKLTVEDIDDSEDIF